MRIALCISGHMRCYKDLIGNLYEFIDFLKTIGNVDIFISTWNQKNTTSSWSAAHGDVEHSTATEYIDQQVLASEFKIPKNHIEINDYIFFNSIYSPLQYNLFTYNQYSWDKRGINNNIVHSTKMLYLIYRCNILKLHQEFINNQKYNLVIRTRPDMMYDIRACSQQIPFKDIENNKIYLMYKPQCLGPYDDRFAFGCSEVMNIYTSAFYRISTINDKNIFGDPETLFYFSIKDLLKNISIVHINKPGLLVSEKTKELR